MSKDLFRSICCKAHRIRELHNRVVDNPAFRVSSLRDRKLQCLKCSVREVDRLFLCYPFLRHMATILLFRIILSIWLLDVQLMYKSGHISKPKAALPSPKFGAAYLTRRQLMIVADFVRNAHLLSSYYTAVLAIVAIALTKSEVVA